MSNTLNLVALQRAASTSLLFKEMARYVFLPFTPNLHFPKPNTALCFAANRKRFMDSADRVMLAVSGSCSAIRSFTLNSPLHVDSSHTKRWTRNVLNFKVSDFILDKTAFESLVLDESACKTLIFDYYREAVPVFENVSQLSLITDFGFCSSFLTLPSLPYVLKKFPNVHTLVIEGPLCGHDHSKIVCDCFSVDFVKLASPVKVLELTINKGSSDEMEQVKRFLEDLSCLELVKVRSFPKDDEEKLSLATRSLVCGHDHSDFVCRCFSVDFVKLSSPVKVLELTMHEGSSDEMEQIKRFLEDLSCLELVKVRAFAKEDEEKLRLATGLLMLPRASSKCKIHVEFC
ncbi:hypothetical protein Bca52824_050925 [Brassica carinata]|uniref:FBD domain-containing protein n=1 Tax=Brassica carinata TaxID=52824 RepID=A0A8X7UH99_BRACI|nr:hypothetical protein Bca52824_050925 [Brassica carinata]